MKAILPLLYVSGPFSADPLLYTRATLMVSTAIYQHTEFVPFVPHLTLLWHMLTPMPYEDWLSIDLTVLTRCHAITRLPGDSPGADREMAYAQQLELPLIEFDSLPQVVKNAYTPALALLL